VAFDGVATEPFGIPTPSGIRSLGRSLGRWLVYGSHLLMILSLSDWDMIHGCWTGFDCGAGRIPRLSKCIRVGVDYVYIYLYFYRVVSILT